MKRRIAFQLGAISDEINADLESALKVMKEFDMEYVEFNTSWGKEVTDWTDDEVKKAIQLIKAYDFKVSMVSSLFLKVCRVDNVEKGKVADSPQFREHIKMLKRSIEIAAACGSKLVRTYSFRRANMVGLGNPSPILPSGGKIDGDTMDKIREGMLIACDIAKVTSMTLGFENVRSCYGNSGQNTREIVEAVDSPVLKVVWDPANAYVSSATAYPEGYEAVKPFIVHLHLKDANIIDRETGLTSWQAIGAGEVDYVGQMRALIEDGYDGLASLETHWHPEGMSREESSRTSFAGLMEIINEVTEQL